MAFYLDHRVSARVAKFAYGTRCAIEFDRNDEQHCLRAASAIPRPSGRTVIPNAFSAILHKVKHIFYVHQQSNLWCREQPSLKQKNFGRTLLWSVQKEIRAKILPQRLSVTGAIYRTLAGQIQNQVRQRPCIIRPLLIFEKGMFSNLCTVHASTSRVGRTLSPRLGFAGMQYFRQHFSIVLMFGLTELEAQISWKEDVSRRL